MKMFKDWWRYVMTVVIASVIYLAAQVMEDDDDDFPDSDMVPA